jgi:hypothetical protein
VYDALKAFPLVGVLGMFYTPLYADRNEAGRTSILSIISRVLDETVRRVAGKKIAAEGEVVVLV